MNKKMIVRIVTSPIDPIANVPEKELIISAV